MHGTTTPGQKTCAPSLSPDLDGGLTRDGFKSNYAYQIAELVMRWSRPTSKGWVPSRPYPIPISARQLRSRKMTKSISLGYHRHDLDVIEGRD